MTAKLKPIFASPHLDIGFVTAPAELGTLISKYDTEILCNALYAIQRMGVEEFFLYMIPATEHSDHALLIKTNEESEGGIAILPMIEGSEERSS